jgi:G3E family GTPase
MRQDGAGELGEKPSMRLSQELSAFVDVALLNKIDLVRNVDLASLEKRISKINPYAGTYRTERRRIDLDKVLGRDGFNLDRILETEPAFRSEKRTRRSDWQPGATAGTTGQTAKFIPWIEAIALAPTSGSRSACAQFLGDKQISHFRLWLYSMQFRQVRRERYGDSEAKKVPTQDLHTVRPPAHDARKTTRTCAGTTSLHSSAAPTPK